MTSSNGNEATNVKADIVKQVEYYFGDFNLPQDKFLQEKIKEKDGWVDIDTMLNFKRLAKISNDPQVILDALKGSSKLMEVNVENKEIRFDMSLSYGSTSFHLTLLFQAITRLSSSRAQWQAKGRADQPDRLLQGCQQKWPTRWSHGLFWSLRKRR